MRITTDGKSLQLEVSCLTKTQCQELLQSVPEFQRTPRGGKVRMFTSQMKDKRWTFLGDPIRISKDGELIDGQHRIMAMLRSGKYPKCVIIKGFDGPRSYPDIDTGSPRKASDYFKMMGGEQYTTMSAAALAFHSLETIGSQCGRGGGDGTRRSHVPYATLWNIYSELKQVFLDGLAITNPLTSFVGTRGGLIAIYARAIKVGYKKDALESQFKSLESGLGSQPMAALRKILVADNNRTRKRIQARERCDLTAKAIEAGIAGKKVGVLKWGTSETVLKFQKPK